MKTWKITDERKNDTFVESLSKDGAINNFCRNLGYKPVIGKFQSHFTILLPNFERPLYKIELVK